MKYASRLTLGLAALVIAAPAFADCPGHSSVTAQTQSTPAPVAQSTAPASTAATDDAVVLTQNQTQTTPPVQK